MWDTDTVAIAYDSDGDVFDQLYSWETAQQYAMDGYKVRAIRDDGIVTMKDIQNMCDYESVLRRDCFGTEN